MTRRQWFWLILGLAILGAMSGGTATVATHAHKSDPCSTAITKSSDPYVSNNDADSAISKCIDSLGGQP